MTLKTSANFLFFFAYLEKMKTNHRLRSADTATVLPGSSAAVTSRSNMTRALKELHFRWRNVIKINVEKQSGEKEKKNLCK